MPTTGPAEPAESSRKRGKGKRPAEAPAADAPERIAVPPLKPRPLLFKILSLVFAAWIAFLVYLYVKTVHPRRSVAPDPVSAVSRAATLMSGGHIAR